jgi:phage recombination protein Bet
MNAVAHVMPASATYTAGQLALIKNTVAKDCNPTEFDLFVTVARNAGLDPFRKQISAIVFSKDDEKKRRMSIITTIDGLRVIAARSRRYRPDEEEPRFEYDPALKGPANPIGLVKASVTIYIADDKREGGWRKVNGVAYWDEFAPIKEEVEAASTGSIPARLARHRQAEEAETPRVAGAGHPATRNQRPMGQDAPRDAGQVRRGPGPAQGVPRRPVRPLRSRRDGPGNGRHHAQRDHRTSRHRDPLARIGAARSIVFQLFPNAPLEAIPLGQVADLVEWPPPRLHPSSRMRWFESANTHPAARVLGARHAGAEYPTRWTAEEVPRGPLFDRDRRGA